MDSHGVPQDHNHGRYGLKLPHEGTSNDPDVERPSPREEDGDFTSFVYCIIGCEEHKKTNWPA